MSLIITKQSGNFFSLELTGESPIISEQNRLTTIGNYCNFKTANGANLILKQNILYSDITIITGVSHVPTSINDLWTSLIDAGFFDGLGVSGGGTSTNRFDELLDTFSYFGRDGQLLVVNESELKLDTVSYQIFTESDALKLDGIETGAQVNVNADWNSTDPTDKRTILNKPDLIIGKTYQIDYPLITVAETQDFIIPEDAVAFRVEINGSPQYKETANNLTDPNTWTQSGTTVTLKTLTEINNYIIIYYS